MMLHKNEGVPIVLKSKELRRGKWGPEEEIYVMEIISDFHRGLLNLPPGTTLRQYLSCQLNCDPMRITKKFTGEACIGKCSFAPVKLNSWENLKELEDAQKKVQRLQKNWHDKLFEQEREFLRKSHGKKRYSENFPPELCREKIISALKGIQSDEDMDELLEWHQYCCDLMAGQGDPNANLDELVTTGEKLLSTVRDRFNEYFVTHEMCNEGDDEEESLSSESSGKMALSDDLCSMAYPNRFQSNNPNYHVDTDKISSYQLEKRKNRSISDMSDKQEDYDDDGTSPKDKKMKLKNKTTVPTTTGFKFNNVSQNDKNIDNNNTYNNYTHNPSEMNNINSNNNDMHAHQQHDGRPMYFHHPAYPTNMSNGGGGGGGYYQTYYDPQYHQSHPHPAYYGYAMPDMGYMQRFGPPHPIFIPHGHPGYMQHHPQHQHHPVYGYMQQQHQQHHNMSSPSNAMMYTPDMSGGDNGVGGGGCGGGDRGCSPLDHCYPSQDTSSHNHNNNSSSSQSLSYSSSESINNNNNDNNTCDNNRDDQCHNNDHDRDRDYHPYGADSTNNNTYNSNNNDNIHEKQEMREHSLSQSSSSSLSSSSITLDDISGGGSSNNNSTDNNVVPITISSEQQCVNDVLEAMLHLKG